ncbi:hypothetical protein ACWDCB_14560 [Streptomyces sp. NPDC001178]
MRSRAGTWGTYACGELRPDLGQLRIALFAFVHQAGHVVEPAGGGGSRHLAHRADGAQRNRIHQAALSPSPVLRRSACPSR